MSVYSKSFYDGQKNGSYTSAKRVVPLLLDSFQIGSVVDIGCGVGTWLRAFTEAGIAEAYGIDGAYVKSESLEIDLCNFKAMDLENIEELDCRYDLACSFEVGEHLSAGRSARLVDVLVKAAPVVAFSAAIPGQGGTDHINEQWQSFWGGLFKTHGYVAVDCIRPAIWFDEDIEYWYRQNIIVYCEENKVPERSNIISLPFEFDRVHPGLLRHTSEKLQTGSAGLRALRNAVLRKVGVRPA